MKTILAVIRSDINQLDSVKSLWTINFWRRSLLLVAWIAAFHLIDRQYTKFSLLGFHTPAYLISICLTTALCAYYFLPLFSDDSDRKKLRKKWAAAYDLIWIAFALIGLSLQGYRVLEADAKLNYSALQNDFQIHLKDMTKRREIWLEKIQIANSGRDDDLRLINELRSVISGEVNPIIEQKPLYITGTLSKSKNFSITADKAYDEIRRDFETNKNYVESLAMQHRKYLYAIPVFIKLFGFTLIAVALGLRLAKAFSDVLDV
jgi:hypothetical protein